MTMNSDESPATSWRTIESTAISIIFWLLLLVCAGMYASLAVAPKLVERRNLQAQQGGLAKRLSEQQQEVHHLSRVAQAIRNDPDFLNRLAANEFAMSPGGSVQYRVASELDFDARVPQIVAISTIEPALWYDEIVESLAGPTTFRRNWGIGTLVLFLFSFFCVNDAFFSGSLGRLGLNLIGNLFQRYLIPPPKLTDTLVIEEPPTQ